MAITSTACTIAVTTGILTTGGTLSSGSLVAGMTITAPDILGVIKSVAVGNGGSAYGAGGPYTGVTLTGSVSGANNAKGTVTIASGIVTGVAVTTAGSGYDPRDVLTISNTQTGNVGSGFSGGCVLNNVSVVLGSQLTGAAGTAGGSTYNTSGLPAAQSIASATFTFTTWEPPPSFATMNNTGVPVLPNFSNGGVPSPVASPYPTIPPPPLPQTLYGSTTQTSYST